MKLTAADCKRNDPRYGVKICEAKPTYEGYCDEHIPYKMRCQRDYEATPRDVRQKYLDALHDGKNIGEACKIADVSLEVGIEITNAAINTHSYHTISKEAA